MIIGLWDEYVINFIKMLQFAISLNKFSMDVNCCRKLIEYDRMLKNCLNVFLYSKCAIKY